MSLSTKLFPLRVVLSVTTGRLLTTRQGPNDNGIGDVYDILNWMTDGSVYTHQIPRVNGECRPWLLRWFPELSTANDALKRLDKLINTKSEEGIEIWLTELQSDLLNEYNVPRIP